MRAATDEVMADVFEVQGEGDDDLARFFDLALVGSLVSLHLAAREGVDPGPAPAVDEAQAGTRSAPPVEPARRGAGASAARRLVEALHDHGHALAAADAHRLEAERLARVLERVEQRRHDACAGLAERVARGRWRRP